MPWKTVSPACWCRPMTPRLSVAPWTPWWPTLRSAKSWGRRDGGGRRSASRHPEWPPRRPISTGSRRVVLLGGGPRPRAYNRWSFAGARILPRSVADASTDHRHYRVCREPHGRVRPLQGRAGLRLEPVAEQNGEHRAPAHEGHLHRVRPEGRLLRPGAARDLGPRLRRAPGGPELRGRVLARAGGDADDQYHLPGQPAGGPPRPQDVAALPGGRLERGVWAGSR